MPSTLSLLVLATGGQVALADKAHCNAHTAGQKQVWVPGCAGAGCLANGRDRDCAWCVHDLEACARGYGDVCRETAAARDAQQVACNENQVDPDFAESVTVYHLNPRSAGDVPADMDTGDALGDLNFYLGEFLLPLECRDPDHGSEFDCNNPERVDPDLVVTKVEMVVDRRYTNYSACNLCENGTDPWILSNHSACEIGSYICDCVDFAHEGKICDPMQVGQQNQGGPRGPWNMCGPEDPDYKCWSGNSMAKTGGLWFSHPSAGLCHSYSQPGSCSWRVLSTSTVQEQCLKDTLMTTVEAAGPECFQACGPRNATSDCWIGCFFDALLGPEARHSNNFSGMPLDDVVSGWTSAFLDEAKGGCPKLQAETVVV